MTFLPESELILNRDGSVYHLGLLPEHLADTIIVVGDPNRVATISRYFDRIDVEINKREFITHTGTIGTKRLTVLSTGMGTDNVEIVMTELDALVNVDLRSRMLKEDKKRLNIIRVGTSGSLRAEVPVDSLLASTSAVGLDTLMCFYQLPQTDLENERGVLLQQRLSLPFQPYCVDGSATLLAQFGFDMVAGNTVTCPGFYAPQGRRIRLGLKIPALIAELNRFDHQGYQLTNFEMETAGYYSLCQLLGHRMISLNAIVANRITNEFSRQADATIDQLVRKVLERA